MFSHSPDGVVFTFVQTKEAVVFTAYPKQGRFYIENTYAMRCVLNIVACCEITGISLQ